MSANLLLRLTSATINKAGTDSIGAQHRRLFLNHDVSIKRSAKHGSKVNKPLKHEFPASRKTLRVHHKDQRLILFEEITNLNLQ